MKAVLFASLVGLSAGTLGPTPAVAWGPISLPQEETTDISGAACDRPDACLLVSDEVQWAREFSREGGTLKAEGKVMLLPKDSKETDAEGVAFQSDGHGGGVYYITGSHGLKKPKYENGARSDGKRQATRYFVYRIPVDPQTGHPAIHPANEDTPAPEVVAKATLDDILKTVPGIKDHVGGQLDQNGVNIEGLAAKDGDLFFGFRAPLLAGKAQVLRLPAEAIFGSRTVHPTPLALDLKGMGIRDIVAVRDGFLVLSGPSAPEIDGAPPSPSPPAPDAAIYFWRPEGPLTCLQKVPYSAAAKPEVLLVLDDKPGVLDVLVMSDEAAGGGPAPYDLAGKTCPKP